MIEKWERYRKFIVAAVGAVITVAPILWPGSSTVETLITALTPFLTAWGVLQVRNEPMPRH